jgi:cytoskeletal protein CcmA (bactofilin family)
MMRPVGKEYLLTLACLLWGVALLGYALGLRMFLVPAVGALVTFSGYLIKRLIMFGRDKPQSQQTAPAPVAMPLTESSLTVIAAGATFTGNIQLTGSLQVFGKVMGNIEVADGRVHLMQGGVVEGEIKAPHLIVDGVLEGVGEAAMVEILSHGRLQGTCRSSALSIEKGGIFLGQSQQLDSPLPASVTRLPEGKSRESANTEAREA